MLTSALGVVFFGAAELVMVSAVTASSLSMIVPSDLVVFIA